MPSLWGLVHQHMTWGRNSSGVCSLQVFEENLSRGSSGKASVANATLGQEQSNEFQMKDIECPKTQNQEEHFGIGQFQVASVVGLPEEMWQGWALGPLQTRPVTWDLWCESVPWILTDCWGTLHHSSTQDSWLLQESVNLFSGSRGATEEAEPSHRQINSSTQIITPALETKISN